MFLAYLYSVKQSIPGKDVFAWLYYIILYIALTALKHEPSHRNRSGDRPAFVLRLVAHLGVTCILLRDGYSAIKHRNQKVYREQFPDLEVDIQNQHCRNDMIFFEVSFFSIFILWCSDSHAQLTLWRGWGPSNYRSWSRNGYIFWILEKQTLCHVKVTVSTVYILQYMN